MLVVIVAVAIILQKEEVAPHIYNDNDSMNKKPLRGGNLFYNIVNAQDKRFLELGLLGLCGRQRVQLQLKGLDDQWQQWYNMN